MQFNTYLSHLAMVHSKTSGVSMLLRCQVQLLEWLALLPDDTTDPSLEGFELDMDSGNLTLSFDEAVQISTFNLAGVALYPNSTSSDAFTFSSITPESLDNSASIRLSIDTNQLNLLKMNTNIATNINNTFVDFGFNVVRDFVERQVPSSRSMATTFIPDTTNPKITSFTFDSPSATLRLTFDEAVIDRDDF